jgi:hypothetical protein
MVKKVSLSEAFLFYFSLFWRAIVLYLLINMVTAFILAYPLSMILETAHPVTLVLFCSVTTVVIFFLAMVIPVKTVLQKFIRRYCSTKKHRPDDPVKQIAAPNHRREVVSSTKQVLS